MSLPDWSVLSPNGSLRAEDGHGDQYASRQGGMCLSGCWCQESRVASLGHVLGEGLWQGKQAAHGALTVFHSVS